MASNCGLALHLQMWDIIIHTKIFWVSQKILSTSSNNFSRPPKSFGQKISSPIQNFCKQLLELNRVLCPDAVL